MTAATLPGWAPAAWQHWHRPWAVMHPARLQAGHANAAADPAQELTLRLHYRAWCDRYALVPALNGFADTPWWQLLGLPATVFDATARRVGLVLLFAAQPRVRLVRATQADALLAPWALQRALLVPEAACTTLRTAQIPPNAAAHAALALRWGMAADTPALLQRLQLRLAPQSGESSPAGPAPGMSARLAALWVAGIRAACQGAGGHA